MKCKGLIEIGKEVMITTGKASGIAWKIKSFYRLLGSPPKPDTFAYEGEKFLEVRLSP